jgi:hypothetical protein
MPGFRGGIHRLYMGAYTVLLGGGEMFDKLDRNH